MPVVSTGQITIVDVNDSKQLQLYISSSQPKTQIYNPNTGTYTPNWATNKPVLTPQLFIAGSSTDIISSPNVTSIKWYVDGTEITASTADYTLASSGVKTLTINNNVLASANTKLFVCEVTYHDPDTGFDVIAKANIEFVKVQSGIDGAAGQNAVVAVLSNDSQTIPTDSAGNNGNYSGAVTTISVFVGATDDSANWTYTVTPSSGVSGNWNSSTRTYTVTNMTTDTGYVDITASKSGYPSVTKRFTLAKAKQGTQGATGSAGQNATAYWLVTPAAIQKNQSGVYTPSSITVQAFSQTGTSAPAAYAGRFIIAESNDGTNYTDKYTSSSNESSKTYTPSAGIKTLRVRLYQAGGTSVLLDEQIIPVVSDGANGQDAITAVVWTPDGNTIKNSQGTLTAKCDVYKGGAVLTSGVTYQWYVQDPSQTTDVGGGVGWKKLDASYNLGTTGYTTNTLTIPASAIAGVESFKCVATYSGQNYSDVCTVIDVSDPIQVVVFSSGGDVFKNGVGSTTLTAKLFRAGTEIDTSGTQYTYKWYKYDKNGTQDPNFGGTGVAYKTGKSITVGGADVDVKATFVVEIS